MNAVIRIVCTGCGRTVPPTFHTCPKAVVAR